MWLIGLALLLSGTSGCEDYQRYVNGKKPPSKPVYDEFLKAENGEPAYVTVQHCLISFKEANDANDVARVKVVSRSKEEAKQLAQEVFDRAKAGEDFDSLVRQYTDDRPPGIYRLSNVGFDSDMRAPKEEDVVYSRTSMVKGFGDLSFHLKVGEIGMVEYDPETSRYGWHIVRRIR